MAKLLTRMLFFHGHFLTMDRLLLDLSLFCIALFLFTYFGIFSKPWDTALEWPFVKLESSSVL